MSEDTLKKDTTLTDEQIHEIYTKLSEVDEASQKALNEASEETENSNYEELEEITPTEVDSKYIDDLAESTAKEYGISKEAFNDLLPLLYKYNKTKDMPKYNDLPDSVKPMVSSLGKLMPGKGRKAAREFALKYLFDSFINDASMNEILDKYNKEIYESMNQTTKEIHDMFNESYDDLFSKIDEIRKTDPERADRIQSIKDAFESAYSLDKVIEYVDHISKKDIEKLASRFSGEATYFNKKVNTFENIYIPDISELPKVIKLYLPQYSELDILCFLVVVIKSTAYELDMSKIENVAYVYRMIDSIYRYKNITPALDDVEADKIFGRVSIVINKIKNL